MTQSSWISGRWAAASAAQIPFPARSHVPCTQKNDRAFVSKRKNPHSPIRSPKKVGKSLVPHTSYVGRRRANGREGGAARAANIMERGSRIVKRPRLDLHSGEGGWTHGRREDAADGDVLAPLSSHFAALSPNVQIISIPFQYQNPEGSNQDILRFKQMQIHFLSLLRHDTVIAYAMSSPLQKHPISSQSARQAFH